MHKWALHISLVCSMLCISLAGLHAQQGFFVPQQGKIYFAGNNSTIFSNVTNRGQFGIGKDAVVNFKGTQWFNDPSAQITDESLKGTGTVGVGGIVRFLIPDSSLPSTISQRQIIIGGYNAANRQGTSFPNLYIGNRWGVQLQDASTKIRNELHFTDGYLYANDNTVVVGDRYAGVISGYDETHFVVTGSSVSGTGVLVREQIGRSDGQVVFPIGTAEGAYTPAAIKLHTRNRDNFYVRVFDSVRGRITDGADLDAQSVGKVWQMGQLVHPGEAIADLFFQHQLVDEGTEFKSKRDLAYVSQYVGGSWDAGDPKLLPQTGTLTSGHVLTNSGLNSRRFTYTISKASYFTKFAGFEDTAKNKTNLWFDAYRTDREHVWVYWTTKPEIRNKYFVLQRRWVYEWDYHNIDTLISMAPGGISYNALDYHVNDPNNYTGVTYYRLVMVDYNSNVSYSPVVAVGGEPQGFGWTIWPNPSPGHFFVGISRPTLVKEVMVWDVLGRLIRREPVANRGLIPMDIKVKGAYVVGLIPYDDTHIETKKLIVIGD